MSAGFARDKEAAEQRQFELEGAARRAEQANQPRYLIVAGVCLCVIASAYTFVARLSYADAQGAIDRQIRQEEAVNDLFAELNAVANTVNSPRFAPATVLGSDLESLGRELGLPNQMNLREQRDGANVPGMTRRRVSFKIQGADAPKLLEWLGTATTRFPGLEIEDLSLKPSRDTVEDDGGWFGWDLSITFTRWERESDGNADSTG